MPQTPSTRWCPTPEQLMILEEMYRSGVRTPNAAEIQQITAHLAYYGRIEGKNVFYWFQNHKARGRQRLRRRLCARHQQPPPPIPPAGAAGTVHPAVMHPSQYAATSFMPHQHHPHLGGYLGTLPLVQHPAAAAAGGGGGGGNKMATAAAGGAAFYSSNDSSSQEEWTMSMEHNCSASPGSSDDSFPLPPCCRPPLKTLDLFPTKSSTSGLRDECSSSKSSSCSTSTN